MAKKKQKYVEKRGLLGNAVDYHVYHMNKSDYLMAFGIGFAGCAVIMAAFFANFILVLAGGILAGMLAPALYRKYKQQNRLKQLRLQFKDVLESLAASYSAGMNTTKAFRDAYKDMEIIYGSESDICKEIHIICMGLESNIGIDKMLIDWSKRCDLEDVTSFAEVFEVCARQGSDMQKIVSDTRDIISDKIEVEMEIDTILAGSRNELNIMAVMPLIIIFALRFMGGSTIVSNSRENIIIKIICLIMFISAYFVGLKITKIKI